MRFHNSPPVAKSKKLSTKLFGLCSDESIISHWMILNRYSLFCVYLISCNIPVHTSYPPGNTEIIKDAIPNPTIPIAIFSYFILSLICFFPS